MQEVARTHLTRKEAAEYTGFTPNTLGKWATLGRGPRFIKIGEGRSSRVRYAISDLDAFLRGDISGRREVLGGSRI